MKKALLLLPLGVAAVQQYCKCQCNNKQLVEKIDKCGLCTEQWCLEQDSMLCKGSDTTEAMVISCFQKELVKELAVVFFFVVAVASLLAKQLYLALTS